MPRVLHRFHCLSPGKCPAAVLQSDAPRGDKTVTLNYLNANRGRIGLSLWRSTISPAKPSRQTLVEPEFAGNNLPLAEIAGCRRRGRFSHEDFACEVEEDAYARVEGRFALTLSKVLRERQPGLYQPHHLQARMPASAHDDVVVHGDAEGFAISMMALVIWISACEGVGSPDGCA